MVSCSSVLLLFDGGICFLFYAAYTTLFGLLTIPWYNVYWRAKGCVLHLVVRMQCDMH